MRYLVRLYNAETLLLIDRRKIDAEHGIRAVVAYVEPFVPGLDVDGLDETLAAAREIPGEPFTLEQGEIIVRIVALGELKTVEP